MLSIHGYDNGWQFRYDSLRIMNELGRVRSKQGMIIGRMLSLGSDSQDEAVLSNLSMELIRSSEIGGEKLNLEEVRSSLVRKLGIAMAGHSPFAGEELSVRLLIEPQIASVSADKNRLKRAIYFQRIRTEIEPPDSGRKRYRSRTGKHNR